MRRARIVVIHSRAPEDVTHPEATAPQEVENVPTWKPLLEDKIIASFLAQDDALAEQLSSLDELDVAALAYGIEARCIGPANTHTCDPVILAKILLSFRRTRFKALKTSISLLQRGLIIGALTRRNHIEAL